MTTKKIEGDAKAAKEDVLSAMGIATRELSKQGLDYEVFASANKVTTVRFASSRLLESKMFLDSGIGIRVVLSGSVGFASSTGTSREAVLATIESAKKAARSKKPDPDFHGLPSPKKSHKMSSAFDPAIRDAGFDDLVVAGIHPLTFAKDISNGKAEISGASNFVYEFASIANSEGVDTSDESTFAFASVTAERADSDHEVSGMGWSLSRSLAKFDAKDAGQEAVNNAMMKMKTAKITPGKFDVVWGNYSITDLAENILSYAVSLASVDYGMSYFAGKLGTKVATDDFSLIDDGTLEGSLAAKQCDDEGLPTHRTPIIEKGVLSNFLSDDYSAKKVNAKSKGKTNYASTGNGFRFDATPGRRYDILPSIYPTNLVIKPGTHSDSELFEGIKRGIYVGRTWYTYPINPMEGDFTCTNRSNTFLIENGEITGALPANSFRINDNLPRLLKKIKGIGKETKAVTVWAGASAVYAPKIRMEGVNVTYSKGAVLGSSN